MPKQVQPNITSRGFKRFGPISSVYGGHIETYESSAAERPRIWVTTTCPSDLNDQSSTPVEAVAHLDIEDATLLRDQLTYLIENHYQLQ